MAKKDKKHDNLTDDLTAKEEALLSSVLGESGTGEEDTESTVENEGEVEEGTESTSGTEMSSDSGESTEETSDDSSSGEEGTHMSTETALLSKMIDKVTFLSGSLANAETAKSSLTRKLETAKAQLADTQSDNTLLAKAAAKACRIYAIQTGTEKKDYASMSPAVLASEFTSLEAKFRETMPEGRQSSVTTDNNMASSVTAFPVSKAKKN